MRKRSHWSRRVLIAGFLSILIPILGTIGFAGVACADGVWLPDNYSTLGERIDKLWSGIFVLVTVIFVITEGLLIWFIIRYRKKPGVRPLYFTDHTGLETVWTVIPGLILLFLAIYQFGAWADARINAPDADGAVRVQISAKQFEWRFRYAGPDGVFATEDDITTTNQMYIPQGTPILAQLRAKDVIHSFFLPNFRVKQDVVPGVTSMLWWDANKTGQFEIACAELCGLGHYRMRALMTVVTPEEFESWLLEKAETKFAPTDWGWDWKEGI